MAITDLASTVTQASAFMSSLTNQNNGLIGPLAGVMGMFFVLKGLWMVKEQATSPGGGHEKGSWLGNIAFGLVFINFWQMQGMINSQLALSGNMLAPNIPQGGYLSQVWTSVKSILYGFGVIAIFRGLLLLKSAGEGGVGQHQSPGWGALWHIVGGAILMKV